MNDCDFCKKEEIENRLIIENDLAVAFPSIKPIGVAHLLVVPKRHAETWDDMTKQEQESVFGLRKKLKKALLKTFDLNGFNFAWNEGKDSGQSVPHFHFHIVPRAKDDKSMYGHEPREFLYRKPLAKDVSPEEELAEIVELIKKNI